MMTLTLPLSGLRAAKRAAGEQAVRLWRAHPRETLASGVLAATILALASAAWAVPSLTALNEESASEAAPPAPPPLLVKPIDSGSALSENLALPLDTGPNPAALPFQLGKAGAAARAQALECLTGAIYYEAGSEDADGQRGVAQVVLNRVRHPAFPASICGVVYEGSTRATGCQFTFTCDGSLLRRPEAAGWARARRVAEAALSGSVYAPVGWATHYHANYVVPYWASSLAKNAVVGTHIFYRWNGGWGRPPAFAQAYARSEPNGAALRASALAVDRTGITPVVAAGQAEAIAEIPGAQALPTVLTRRGERQVAIRFNLAAREAVEKAVATPKAETVKSDNLRWGLSTGTASTEKPLGKALPAMLPPAAGADQ
ncbi:MAG TPA: cell wall hydrolase [Sphingomicrobium sp.]|nr:cell wall hydrolase [Sphingomicrobium sp.]